MINCVINQNHEECIDCISKNAVLNVPDIPQTIEVFEADLELQSCHGSDYLKCAFVIAGCASSCSSSNVRKYV